MMTVLETVNAATEYLQRYAVESPRLNAEHLLAHVLGKKRLDLYLEFDRPLSDADRAPLRELVKQRGQGKPLQHLLGTAEFFGRTFLCDERGLIPRPETEQLIEFVLARGDFANALDIGTGSGVIGITLALEKPTARVTATDISPEALALAQENAAKTNADLTFFQADLWPPGDEQYDRIVANLPYIPASELATLQREVQHDPASALDGGENGLVIIERLIATAHSHLRPGGIVALEIGHDQAPAVKQLFTQHNFRDIMGYADYQGIERFVFAIYG
jgi:release factor glutamine methyltransferase